MAKCKYKWGGTWDNLDEMLEEQKRGLDCSESYKRNDRILIGSWKQVCNFIHEETN